MAFRMLVIALTPVAELASRSLLSPALLHKKIMVSCFRRSPQSGATGGLCSQATGHVARKCKDQPRNWDSRRGSTLWATEATLLRSCPKLTFLFCRRGGKG